MTDLTSEFRKLVAEITGSQDKSKRNDVLPPVRKNPRLAQDPFLKEAYEIVKEHLIEKPFLPATTHPLTRRRPSLFQGIFLLSIRRVYLNLSRHSVGAGFSRSTPQITISDLKNELLTTAGSPITSLTDIERDEIDLHAKVIMQKSMDRIEKLQETEQVRQNSILNNPWFKILPNLRLPEEHDIIAAHRSSVIWLLNMRLIQVSKLQKDQQEARILKEIEKRESTLFKQSSKPMTPPLTLRDLLEEEKKASHKSKESGDLIEDDDIEQHLTAEQKMMLELENETMMKELEFTLSQVNKAEQALLEISNLQSVLSNHLAVQTQQTDRLYAEAIATTSRVQEGNLMLTKARQRASDARKWILIFLILASFVLLFLDWYD
ncbi:hypothetical protein G9A89_006479 [Geosiphon pyriformis]|nr:hypothetical protein G9A89_006479 [Geosiphon pyriformis]